MGSLANQTEQAVLNHWFGSTTPSVPVTYYLALSTTIPADDGTNVTEPVGNGYERVAVTNNTTNFPGASIGNPTVKTNGTTIIWPTASGGSWGNIQSAPIYDAASGGNMIAAGTLTTPRTVNDTDTFQINVGQLQITLD